MREVCDAQRSSAATDDVAGADVRRLRPKGPLAQSDVAPVRRDLRGHLAALERAIAHVLTDHTKLFKQSSDN